MDKQSELLQWIEIANNDLRVAQYLAKNMRPVSYEIICFHCQQAVEKYLKWVLVLIGRTPLIVGQDAQCKECWVAVRDTVITSKTYLIKIACKENINGIKAFLLGSG